MQFKLGDKVRFYAVMRKEHSNNGYRDIGTVWVSKDVPVHTGMIVGKRTLTRGTYHLGSTAYDDDGTYFQATGGVSVWLVATDLRHTCYVHPANIEPIEQETRLGG